MKNYKILFILVGISVTGCVRTNYVPYSAVKYSVVSDHSIRVYDGDLATINSAGAVNIGSVTTSGSHGFSTSEDNIDEAVQVLHDHGATYVYCGPVHHQHVTCYGYYVERAAWPYLPGYLRPAAS